MFRGISQTNEKPAIQGGFDLAHKSGFYAGTWASNISWLSDANPDVNASIEWDFYGGYKLPLPQDFVVDLGVLYYWYPGSYPSGYDPKPNTAELYAALNWKMLQVKYSYAVTDTFGFPNSDGSYYIEGNVNWDVVEKVNDTIGKVTLIGTCLKLVIEHAVAARAIFHDDGLPPTRRQFVCEQPCADIDAAARAERNDESHGPAWPCVRGGAWRRHNRREITADIARKAAIRIEWAQFGMTVRCMFSSTGRAAVQD